MNNESFDSNKLIYEITNANNYISSIIKNSNYISDNNNEYALMNDSLSKAQGLYWNDQDSIGKLLRPMAVYIGTKALSGNIEAAYKVGASIQMIHNFSLVHDDIQDKSLTRRGKPSLWSEIGIPQAINIGDELFALSSYPINLLPQSNVSYENTLAIIKIIQYNIIKLTHGQFLDIHFENSDLISKKQYLRMIEDKTGALFGAAFESAALISNRKSLDKTLRNFGLSLGIAFQAIDDYLNIWGKDKININKMGEDLINRKKSLPFILAYELNSSVQNELTKIYSNTYKLSNIDKLITLFNDLNIQEKCLEFINQKISISDKILYSSKELTDNEKNNLLNFKNIILERIK